MKKLSLFSATLLDRITCRVKGHNVEESQVKFGDQFISSISCNRCGRSFITESPEKLADMILNKDGINKELNEVINSEQFKTELEDVKKRVIRFMGSYKPYKRFKFRIISNGTGINCSDLWHFLYLGPTSEFLLIEKANICPSCGNRGFLPKDGRIEKLQCSKCNMEFSSEKIERIMGNCECTILEPNESLQRVAYSHR